ETAPGSKVSVWDNGSACRDDVGIAPRRRSPANPAGKPCRSRAGDAAAPRGSAEIPAGTPRAHEPTRLGKRRTTPRRWREGVAGGAPPRTREDLHVVESREDVCARGAHEAQRVPHG